MRLYSIGLIPLFLATAAQSQVLDLPQAGWELRRGEVAVVEPARLRPGSDPGLLTQSAGLLTTAAWPVSSQPYRGYGFAGGTLYTGVTAATFYDDNVFAGRTQRLSDTAFVARPEFAWVTRGQNYAAAIDGFVEARRYVRYDSEDQVNGGVGGSFKVVPDADTQVIGGARYIHGHLDRGTSETIGPGGVLLSTTFNKPIDYDQASGSLAVNKRFANWWTQVGIAGTAIKFENAALPGGVLVDLSYANGGTGAVNGRVGVVVAPLTSVFVEAAGNKRSWDVSAFNSEGYRVVGGVLFEPGPNARLRGEVWAGYMNQNYNGASFRTVSNWTYGAAMAFGFTNQLTGVVEGRREAKEAALSLGVIGPNTLGTSVAVCAVTPGATCVSAIQSAVSGRLDYRIVPNVVIGGGVSYVVDEYLGTAAANRTDRALSPLASIKYIPNDRIAFGFDYRRINFDPSGGQAAGVAAISYNRNVYVLSMNGKF